MRKRNLILGVIGVVIGATLLGYLFFSVLLVNSFPFTTKASELSQLKNIGKTTNLSRLLLAEKLFAGRFPSGAFVSNFVPSDKTFHGDIVYTFGQVLAYSDTNKRPIKYVTITTADLNGKTIPIISEKVLNKNGTVSFLHFAYSDEIDSALKQFNFPNSYLVPVAWAESCKQESVSTKICERLNRQQVKELTTQWVETGIVPPALESILLIPYLATW